MDILWVSQNSENVCAVQQTLIDNALHMHHTQDGQDALFIAATQSPKLTIIDSDITSITQDCLANYIQQNFALSAVKLNTADLNWETIVDFITTQFSRSSNIGQLLPKVIDQLALTHCEHKLLSYLYKLEGQVIDKAELQCKALNKEYTKLDRNLDMHICNIRKKLSEYGLPRSLIRTVRGNGYILSL